MRLETVLSFHLHHLRMARAEEMERPPDGTGMDRLPEPIQHKYGMFQDGIHKPSPTNRNEGSKVRHFGN
jgi:hypothetical protein